MSLKNSYNTMALQGLEFDDMEFVDQFNLDPNLAYTPKINFAMLDNVYQKNINNLVEEGIPRDKAKIQAGRLRADAKKKVMELMKLRKK